MDPNVLQAKALKVLEKTNQKGGVVVMPTGTGKTFLASLWFKRIVDLEPRAKLLFICHNRDILSQANEKEFQGCLKHLDIDFGYYTAKKKEYKQCTFATTQTLTRSLSKFEPDYFDYIIVDEAHHYQAKTFKKVLEYFDPKFMLGLTATPNRMDNKSIFEIIGKQICNSKTSDAIKEGLLCKINYWFVDNDIDFSDVKWNGSNYSEKDLNRVICVKEYDDSILKEYNEILRYKFQKKKTICFCTTVEHVHRMTELFNKNGFKAVGLTSKNKEGTGNVNSKERRKIINGFKDGDYDIIFVRDLFNEGIDIPSCDSIMMLRPTHSHTIFAQQIGRGLRNAEEKKDVLILDFTGNCNSCVLNYEYLGDVTGVDMNERLRKSTKSKKRIDIIEFSNGCKIRLTRKKVDILNDRLDSLPLTLEQAIEKYNEIYNTRPRRSYLEEKNKGVYRIFKKNGLLDRYCIIPKNKILNRAIEKYNEIYKTKPLISQLKRDNKSIYNALLKNGLLDEYCLSKLYWAIEKYNEIYKTKPYRSQLYKKNKSIYDVFKKNGLLDEYCLSSQEIKRPTLDDAIKILKNKFPKYKPGIGQLQEYDFRIYHILRRNGVIDKYCSRKRKKNFDRSTKEPLNLSSQNKTTSQPNIKITATYKPITKIKKKRRNKSGKPSVYSKDLVRKEYKSKEDKRDIREKIISNIQDGDKVLLLESPDLSAIKEIEKQNKKPSKIVIPNDKEFKRLAEEISKYKTDRNIEIINTSVLQYLVDTKEKFDFVWLDYCGAFSYYIEDLDVLFNKHLTDMKLILTYNLFDPAKEDDSYYFTKVIDYVLSKVSETNKIRLINDVTYRYKKNMYNLGFEIGNPKNNTKDFKLNKEKDETTRKSSH